MDERQHKEARTIGQKVFFLLLTSVSASLVLIPGSHPSASGLVGIAIAPIPFLVDVMLARRASSGRRVSR